ncbi:MAG: hypothetical protein HOO99_16775 [Hyphomicrobiaceae bacterium]|nr:hypothetical protein [Hyphomicrobiaceae bacterium]
MSRMFIAGSLLLIPVAVMPVTSAMAQSAVPLAIADEAVVPMARLFPTAPVARRIDPIVPAVKRAAPGTLSALTSKAVSRLTALVAPKPVRAVRPVVGSGIAKVAEPQLTAPPQEIVRAPAISTPVADAQATAVASASVPVPVPVTRRGASSVRTAAVAPTVEVFTCKWGQDYSTKLKRCVGSTAALAGPPQGAATLNVSTPKSGLTVAATRRQAPQAVTKTGVTVANTPLTPGAIAGASMAKQAETGIANAVTAARAKAAATKTAGAKPPLDANARMSLGATKK